MATVDFSVISPALATILANRIAGQIQRAATLPQLIPVRNDVVGKNVQFDARFGSAVGAAVADGATISTFNNDTKVPAVLQWAEYNDSFKLTGRALATAANTGNPSQLANLFLDEIGDSGERLAKGLALDSWTGDAGGSPAEIAGLLATTNAALGATGTYAGLARGTYAQWASNSIDVTTILAGGDPLGLVSSYANNKLIIVALRKLRTAITNASSKVPDLVIMGPALFEKFALAEQQSRRWVQDVRLNKGMIHLDYGVSALSFDGIPVVEDVDCPAGKAVMLNTSEMYYAQLMPSALEMSLSMGMRQLAGTPDQINNLTGRTPIVAHVVPFHRDGNSYSFGLYTYLQLVVRQPNCMGQLNGFA